MAAAPPPRFRAILLNMYSTIIEKGAGFVKNDFPRAFAPIRQNYILTFAPFSFIMAKLNFIRGSTHSVEKSRSLVERARLEIVYTPKGYRGFESLLLRQKSTVILIELRWTFSMPENRLKSDFSAVSAHKRPRCRAILRRGFMRFVMIAAFCTAVIVKQPSNR